MNLEDVFEHKKKEREKLSQVLPLKQPYAIYFNISNICNFKCFYCVHSDNDQNSKYKRPLKMMEFDLLKRCIDYLKKEEIHLKMIDLSGLGEPLLNKEFCRMVRYIKEQNVAECVETITNASLLTKEYCDDIISSKLDKIRISLQGLSSEDYFNVSKVEMDYYKFYENIKYLYKNKDNLFVYIKIMDVMVKDEEKKKMFFQLFSDIADEVYIESLMPITDYMDYSAGGIVIFQKLYMENK